MSSRPDTLLAFFNAAQTLAAPFLLLKKWRRYRARGDAYEWQLARWSPKPLTEDKKGEFHLVFVAMGFAETRLAARLTRFIQEKFPTVRVTWAIRNLEAACEGGAVPADQVVVPLPFDYFWPVARWQRIVAPDAVVFIERFAFVNMARGLKNRGVKVAAVAARTRDHRKGGSHWSGIYERWLWSAFDLICLRSEEERKKLGSNVPPSTQTRITGSLKFWAELPPIEPQKLDDLNAWLGSRLENKDKRPLVAAGSTQPGDEAWLFDAYAPLRERYHARLLLAPRHTTRAAEVEELASSRGWKVARRSQPTGDPESADILLLDTLGELVHSYGAAQAAFVGGTLSGTGHNVLEPIAHGIPVFFGPKRGTFGAEQEMCEMAGAGFRVRAPEELTRGWERAIVDENWRREIRNSALNLNAEGTRSWKATVDAISGLLQDGGVKTHI